MKVIGHRGARKIHTENSLEALQQAAKYGADAVEFDVRLNEANELVLAHNYRDKDNADLTSFEQVISHGINIPLAIDLKTRGIAKAIIPALDGHTGEIAYINSIFSEDLIKIKRAYPDVRLTLHEI